MGSPQLEPARPAFLRLSFAPDLASAREVSQAVRNFLAGLGVSEKELFSYELCVAEASNNAVEYAVGRSRSLRPVAEALLTNTQIELRITDHTPGFSLPDRIPPPPPRNDRGRGLFLIQTVMDEVQYLRGTSENTLVMRKRRVAPAFPAQGAEAAPKPRERSAAPPRPAPRPSHAGAGALAHP
jgi:anti-sigma regulatory factor (Ser/Thr protein kinase)